jgi:hypothetical protein
MDFSQINLSTDILILLTIALVVMCGMLLGHNKVKTFALSVYVGIVLATQLGSTVHGFLISHGISLMTIAQTRILLLIAPILILELGKTHYRKGHRGSFILTLVLSVLVAALIISSILSLLEPDSLKNVLDQSSLAWPLYHFRLWWVAAVPVAVLIESFARSKRED